MSTADPTVFQPAFCHRGDCKANPDSPFCAGCGADIAAYLKATTDSHAPVPAPEAEPVTQQMSSTGPLKIFPSAPATSTVTGQIPPTPASAPSVVAAQRSGLSALAHDRMSVAVFCAALLAGAGAAVAGGLI